MHILTAENKYEFKGLSSSQVLLIRSTSLSNYQRRHNCKSRCFGILLTAAFRSGLTQ